MGGIRATLAGLLPSPRMDVAAWRPAVLLLQEGVDLIWSSREKPLLRGALSKAIAIPAENNQESQYHSCPRAVILILGSSRQAKIFKERPGGWDSHGGFDKAAHIPEDLGGCVQEGTQEKGERACLSAWLCWPCRQRKPGQACELHAWPQQEEGKPYWLQAFKQNLQPAIGWLWSYAYPDQFLGSQANDEAEIFFFFLKHWH